MAQITALSFIVPVRDLDAAVRFYTSAFGLEVVFQADQIAFVGVAGSDTAIGLLRDPATAGTGPRNVGVHPDHDVGVDPVVAAVVAAGGRVVERGEHAPGAPFVRIADPDGNILWL